MEFYVDEQFINYGTFIFSFYDTDFLEEFYNYSITTQEKKKLALLLTLIFETNTHSEN